jgi:hypothetical protein
MRHRGAMFVKRRPDDQPRASGRVCPGGLLR